MKRSPKIYICSTFLNMKPKRILSLKIISSYAFKSQFTLNFDSFSSSNITTLKRTRSKHAAGVNKHWISSTVAEPEVQSVIKDLNYGIDLHSQQTFIFLYFSHIATSWHEYVISYSNPSNDRRRKKNCFVIKLFLKVFLSHSQYRTDGQIWFWYF